MFYKPFVLFIVFNNCIIAVKTDSFTFTLLSTSKENSSLVLVDPGVKYHISTILQTLISDNTDPLLTSYIQNKLIEIYNEAFSYQIEITNLTKNIYTSNVNLTVNIVNITSVYNNAQRNTLNQINVTYYIASLGNDTVLYIPAVICKAVFDQYLSVKGIQYMALKFSRIIIEPAKLVLDNDVNENIFTAPVIFGIVISCLLFSIFLIWIILFNYYKFTKFRKVYCNKGIHCSVSDLDNEVKESTSFTNGIVENSDEKTENDLEESKNSPTNLEPQQEKIAMIDSETAQINDNEVENHPNDPPLHQITDISDMTLTSSPAFNNFNSNGTNLNELETNIKKLGEGNDVGMKHHQPMDISSIFDYPHVRGSAIWNHYKTSDEANHILSNNVLQNNGQNLGSEFLSEVNNGKPHLKPSSATETGQIILNAQLLNKLGPISKMDYIKNMKLKSALQKHGLLNDDHYSNIILYSNSFYS